MFLQNIHSMQRRLAIFAGIGQFSLVIALLLERFGGRFLPAGFPGDFLAGFFTGLSLVFNLALLITYSKYARSR